ncbi:MAG: nucleotidyl transferase AbiEii/AbiGii toxin family protein [Deltaproteobacteria bacterium]|nr:nucleotidyl transferase AbiEii/AbiGii toxin family protein [Deltaproteobacteria bacterium]
MGDRFTLLDEPYYRALCLVSEVLQRAGLDFCLVGGGAAQAWIASLRTDSGARSLAEEPRLRSALRKTRDLDFATRVDPAEMLPVLNELAAETGRDAHVLGARAMRLGPVAVSLTLGPEDLSGMSELYDDFLESRAPIRLRREARVDELPTIGLPELLATKLTRRGDKAKDILDVTQLLAALHDAWQTADLERLRRLVAQRPDALQLLAEIEQAIEEGEAT